MIFEKSSALPSTQLKKPSAGSCWNADANSLKAIRRVLLLILLVPLAACFEEETVAVGYSAINHTDKWIISVIINDEGGILGAAPQGEGGEVCCVVLPRKWRSGLRAKIEWRYDSTPKLDGNGKVITNDGVPVLIESPWNERTIELPQYDSHVGRFQLHFYANGEVKSVISNFLPGHAQYPEPK